MQNNHNLSYIHPNAKLGENVIVEPFATIYDDVEIGEGTWIGPHVTIMSGARIGQNCKIHPGAVISNIPQDLKFQGEDTTVRIGDNTVIRECVTINRGTNDRNETEIGSNCLLMAYVHVAHDCVVGDNVILANSVQLGGHVNVDYHAIIGGTSAVHQFVKIGAHSMIQGGSKVLKDVPPFVKAGHDPLVYGGVNSVGLRRREFANEDIHHIQDIYRVVFQKGFNYSQAIAYLEENFEESNSRNTILDFMRVSVKEGRGLIKGANRR